MKITHIITGLEDGGAEAVLYRLCRHDETNCHHVVSLMDGGKYGPLLKHAGITVNWLSMPRGHLTMKGLIKLWELLRKEQPDVVQTWMYHANLIGGVMARLAGIRSICWGIHNTNLVFGQSKRSTIGIAGLCAYLSGSLPDHIVSCSQRAVQSHLALGYLPDKFRLIPNGYEIDRFAPQPCARKQIRKIWGFEETDPVIGMVARFDPQKDHRNLITALGLLKRNGHSFHCMLIGKGMVATDNALKAWLRSAGVLDEVRMLGPRSDIPAVMNALDVHVLSSAYGEAFPNVLAEAMACATPCVTTDVGDAALIVGQTGWVVPPHNAEALAEGMASALNALKDSPEWNERMQAARLRIVQHFSIERMVNAYRVIWRKTLRKKVAGKC